MVLWNFKRTQIFAWASWSNSSLRYQMRQHFHKLKQWGDLNRGLRIIHHSQTITYQISSGDSGIYGARVLWRKLWHESWHLCVWNVCFGNGNFRVPIQGMWQSSLNLQESQWRNQTKSYGWNFRWRGSVIHWYVYNRKEQMTHSFLIAWI